MKITSIAILFFMGANVIASAGECRDRFISILTDVAPKGPLKMIVTSHLNGATTMKSEFLQMGLDHWLNKGIEPQGMPSTLAYNHSMYNSFDNGKSWRKKSDLDAEKARRDSLKLLSEEVKSTRNAICGEVKIDGIAYDWVEADYNSLRDKETKYHNKYWINKETGWLAKTSNQIDNPNYKTLVIQTIDKAPNLSLPKPN